MVVQSWIIVGLIVGWLIGMFMGRRLGIAGDIILGIIGGLVGSSFIVILFVVSDAVNGANFISAVIAFACAAILLAVKRLVIRSHTA